MIVKFVKCRGIIVVVEVIVEVDGKLVVSGMLIFVIGNWR